MVVDYLFCTKLIKNEYLLKSSPVLGFWNGWEKFLTLTFNGVGKLTENVKITTQM
jgi:hypothetical protein